MNREEWLTLLEELFDEPTIKCLERIGVSAGWQALEAGAGRGSIALWLARQVGPEGHVLATDLDMRFLDDLDEPNLEVRRHDVLSDELAADSLDLIHFRSLLMVVPEPERALERMVRWLKPGGILLAEEPWIDAGLLSPDSVVASAVRNQDRTAPHIDGGFARRLPLALRGAGLEDVEADGRMVFFEGGSSHAAFYRRSLQQRIKPLVADGTLDVAEVEALNARFEDPDWCDCGWPRIASWGRKPKAS